MAVVARVLCENRRSMTRSGREALFDRVYDDPGR
jgi:hypothetical protein